MSSRMERYSKTNEQDLVYPSFSNRSQKNKKLYSEIQDIQSYSNIEGVATIEKTNEIDITKVKNMLKNRENYKKQKQFGSVISSETIIEEQVEDTILEEKNYDIKDILSKIKTENSNTRSATLTEEQYEFLKNLNNRRKIADIDEEQELEVKDAGLLDELISDTMVGTSPSIKNIIDNEKEKQFNIASTEELDKSFYTSSFGFTQSDFEELKNMNTNINNSNKAIIVLLSILILIAIIFLTFMIVK